MFRSMADDGAAGTDVIPFEEQHWYTIEDNCWPAIMLCSSNTDDAAIVLIYTHCRSMGRIRDN